MRGHNSQRARRCHSGHSDAQCAGHAHARCVGHAHARCADRGRLRRALRGQDGGIFFVVNTGGGTLTIDSSTLQGNPSGQFQDAPGIFDSVNGHDTQPVVAGSTVS